MLQFRWLWSNIIRICVLYCVYLPPSTFENYFLAKVLTKNWILSVYVCVYLYLVWHLIVWWICTSAKVKGQDHRCAYQDVLIYWCIQYPFTRQAVCWGLLITLSPILHVHTSGKDEGQDHRSKVKFTKVKNVEIFIFSLYYTLRIFLKHPVEHWATELFPFPVLVAACLTHGKS